MPVDFMAWLWCYICYVSVVGVTKMGNTLPKVGLGPTSLAFRASVLPLITPGRLPDVTTILYPPVYAAPCLRGVPCTGS